MALSKEEAQKVMDAVPAAKHHLKVFEVELSALIGATDNEELSKGIVGMASQLSGVNDTQQAQSIKKWCDEHLGKGLVDSILLKGNKPAIARLNLTNLKQLCETSQDTFRGMP